MKTTTKRLERSMIKLYRAFHNGTLDAMDCKHCAVGNLCNNADDWARITSISNRNSSLKSISMTGYSTDEINNIECYFLAGLSAKEWRSERLVFRNAISNNDVKSGRNSKEEQKELQFKGLEAVLKYLCELDAVENVLDYWSLFEFDKENNPIKELIF